MACDRASAKGPVSAQSTHSRLPAMRLETESPETDTVRRGDLWEQHGSDVVHLFASFGRPNDHTFVFIEQEIVPLVQAPQNQHHICLATVVPRLATSDLCATENNRSRGNTTKVKSQREVTTTSAVLARYNLPAIALLTCSGSSRFVQPIVNAPQSRKPQTRANGQSSTASCE